MAEVFCATAALRRGAAVRESERRSEPRLFRRRRHRGSDYQSGKAFWTRRHRSQLRICLQRATRGPGRRGSRPRRPLRRRGQRPARRGANPHQRATSRRDDRRQPLGRSVRPWRGRGFCRPGRDEQRYRQIARHDPDSIGEATDGAPADRQSRGLRLLSARRTGSADGAPGSPAGGAGFLRESGRSRSILCRGVCGRRPHRREQLALQLRRRAPKRSGAQASL